MRQELGCRSQQNRQKLQALPPSRRGCVIHGNGHGCCNVPPCSLVLVTGPMALVQITAVLRRSHSLSAS